MPPHHRRDTGKKERAEHRASLDQQYREWLAASQQPNTPRRRPQPSRCGPVTITQADGTPSIVELDHGSEYERYINSNKWRATRQRFIQAGHAKTCRGCGKRWGKGDHIHHQTYENLGEEKMEDLVAVCEPCHVKIHQLHRRPEVRKRGLRYATELVTKRTKITKPAKAQKRERYLEQLERKAERLAQRRVQPPKRKHDPKFDPRLTKAKAQAQAQS